jgi:hypothetical protein
VRACRAQVPKAVHELLGKDAPDVGIEAVGLHYVRSMLHKLEIAMNVETDPSEMLNEIIYTTRPVRRAPQCTLPVLMHACRHARNSLCFQSCSHGNAVSRCEHNAMPAAASKQQTTP